MVHRTLHTWDSGLSISLIKAQYYYVRLSLLFLY